MGGGDLRRYRSDFEDFEAVAMVNLYDGSVILVGHS